MTPEEHKLIITMLREQQVTIAALTEILKAHGIVRDGDLVAYGLELRSSGAVQLIEDRLVEAYRGNGENLGVIVPELPEGLH